MTSPQPSSEQPLPEPAVDEAAIEAAKSKVGAGARATTANVRASAKQATALITTPDALRKSARQQTDMLKGQQVGRELQAQLASAVSVAIEIQYIYKAEGASWLTT